MAEEKVDYIYVESNLAGADRNRVALHEIDPLHPGGSVVVAGPGAHKVAKTGFVMQRLREGYLKEAEGGTAEADKRAKARAEMADAEEGPREAEGYGGADRAAAEPTANEKAGLNNDGSKAESKK